MLVVTVLITCMHLARNFESVRSQYEMHGILPSIPPLSGQQFSAQEMARHIVGVDAVIAGDDDIDRSVLEAGKAAGLKAVVKWGIGTDGIDKQHAAKIGIPVFNTPSVFGEEVADLAISHLLLLARGTHFMDGSVRQGDWFKAEGRSLYGLTAGIVGLGSIGSAIARRVRGFGMNAVGCDIEALPSERLNDLQIRQLGFQEVLTVADAVFIACALTHENEHLIDEKALSRMKQNAWLINVSRGPLVDESALAQALAESRIAGAGLDVFEEEPLPSHSPLRAVADKCTFSTHNGSNTSEAVNRINQMTTDILLDVLKLKPADFKLNRVA